MSCPLPRLFPAVVLCTFLLPVILASNIKPYASSSSPFESSLKVLQKSINYSFENDSLLRRAMTHPSFSEENNKAIAVVGLNVINTFVAIRSVGKDIDVSSKDLNRLIAQVSNIETCCADGMRLRLHNVVRIASKTNSTSPPVVCGALRALFGAVALDSGTSDAAGTIFWRVHTGEAQIALF